MLIQQNTKGKLLKAQPLPSSTPSAHQSTQRQTPLSTRVTVHSNCTPERDASNACMQVWLEGAKRPYNGNHHAADVINNKLYLFGGLGGSSEGTVQIGSLNAAEVGGQLTMTWEKGEDAPVESGSSISAYIDGLVRPCITSCLPILLHDAFICVLNRGDNIVPGAPLLMNLFQTGNRKKKK